MSTEPTALTEDATTEVLRLEDARYQAIIDRRYDDFAAVCHPALTYCHSDGTRDTLDAYLAKCRDGFYDYHRIDHPVTSVIEHGDTIVVVGEMNADITAGGKDKTLANDSIAVWVRDSATWKLLAYQPTPVAR